MTAPKRKWTRGPDRESWVSGIWRATPVIYNTQAFRGLIWGLWRAGVEVRSRSTKKTPSKPVTFLALQRAKAYAERLAAQEPAPTGDQLRADLKASRRAGL